MNINFMNKIPDDKNDDHSRQDYQNNEDVQKPNDPYNQGYSANSELNSSSGSSKNDENNRDFQRETYSYVYPNYERTQPVNNSIGSSNQNPPPPKKDKARIIGFIAWTLALVVLFSSVTGGLVYSYMRIRIQPELETGSQTEVTDENNEEDSAQNDDSDVQATEPVGNGLEADSDARNRHFSIGSAAARRDGDVDPLSIIEIAEKGKPAVVAISTEITVRDFFGQTGSVPAAGSGFIISEDGYIVTNNHVVENASTITIFLDNGDLYDARFVGSDPQNDVAVLKIEGNNYPTVVLGDSSDIMVGELAVAIGNPLGQLSGTVTAGIVSGLDRAITIDGQTLNLLQTDAAINQGNSGGALFNSFGEVIGINTAKSAGAGIEGLGFAIPINHAKPIIESIIQSGYVTGRPKIGVATQDLSQQMAEYYDLTEGVYVVSVEPNSAAERAGLRRGDVIVKTNGIETLTTAQINEIKNAFEPGDEMVLTIAREGNELEITIVLDEDVPYDVVPATSRYSPEKDKII